MSYIDRPNCKVYYDIHVAGTDWVTLVNGHTRTSTDFRTLAKKLNSVGFSVMVFDNRASGKSETSIPFTMNDIIEDIKAILATEGIHSSHVLGISMGGGIALGLTLAHPELINKLILISTAASKRWIPKNSKEWGNTHESVKEKMTTYFTPDFVERNKLLLDAMSKQILTAIATKNFHQQVDLQRAVMADFDATERLREIKADTLVIHGAADNIIKVEAGEELAAHIPNTELKLFADAGHLLLAEKPDQLYQSVVDFLQK